MRRFTVSGLVPCDPIDLADRLLDATAAPVIWPQIQADAAEDGSVPGWLECSVSPEDSEADARGGALHVRLRRASPMEVQERTGGDLTVHRFLPATGGCLWTVESHASPRSGESWLHFVRRRKHDQQRAMALVDTAASYFASLL
jgi:hypothetical protein